MYKFYVLRSRNNHGALIESTPCQNQESIIMTICLRHDCILTERDERVGAKGHDRAPARAQHVDKNAWCVGRANTHHEYVSFYKQDNPRRTPLFIADCFVFEKFLFFLFPPPRQTRKDSIILMRLILSLSSYNFDIFLLLKNYFAQMQSNYNIFFKYYKTLLQF